MSALWSSHTTLPRAGCTEAVSYNPQRNHCPTQETETWLILASPVETSPQRIDAPIGELLLFVLSNWIDPLEKRLVQIKWKFSGKGQTSILISQLSWRKGFQVLLHGPSLYKKMGPFLPQPHSSPQPPTSRSSPFLLLVPFDQSPCYLTGARAWMELYQSLSSLQIHD